MYDMMDEAEKQLKELYDGIRLQVAPSQEILRKVYACSAVTADLLQLMRVRLTEIGGEFDAEAERSRLRMLLDNEYARSAGSAVSSITARSYHHSEHLSESPESISAANRAKIDMEAAIEAQRLQLKKLENQRAIDILIIRLHFISIVHC